MALLICWKDSFMLLYSDTITRFVDLLRPRHDHDARPSYCSPVRTRLAPAFNAWRARRHTCATRPRASLPLCKSRRPALLGLENMHNEVIRAYFPNRRMFKKSCAASSVNVDVCSCQSFLPLDHRWRVIPGTELTTSSAGYSRPQHPSSRFYPSPCSLAAAAAATRRL
jgi:hypothetical protein